MGDSSLTIETLFKNAGVKEVSQRLAEAFEKGEWKVDRIIRLEPKQEKIQQYTSFKDLKDGDIFDLISVIEYQHKKQNISTHAEQNHRYLCTESSTPISSMGTSNYKQLSPTTIASQRKTDIAIFMNNLYTLEDNKTYLKVADQSNDESNDDGVLLSKQNIFIRKAYCTLYNIINGKKDDNKKHPFIVLGNPGIGKSFFGFYLIWLFIQNKQPFLYKPQASIFKDNHFIYCTFETIPYNARLFDYEKEALSYNEKKEAWYISDASYPSESFANSCKRSVYITSPKSMEEDSIIRRRNQVLKDPNLNRLFMPTWSKEEFSDLCDCFYPSENEKKDATLNLYSIFGGIARHCLSSMKVDDAKKLINGYINRSSPLKSVQAAYVNTELYNPEVCQGIIHYNINPDTCTFYSDEKFPFKIASAYVASQLCSNYHNDFGNYAKKLIDYAVSDVFQNTAFNAYAGIVFEKWTFSRILEKDETIAKSLSDDNRNSIDISSLINSSMHQIEKIDEIREMLASRKMKNKTGKDEAKFIMMPPNFPSIDALMISQNPCFFQITVGKTHEIKATLELKELIDLLLSDLINEPDYTFDFFYIVPQSLYENYDVQNITSSSSKENSKKINELNIKLKRKDLKNPNNKQELENLQKEYDDLSEKNNSECQNRVDFVNKHICQCVLTFKEKQ